MSAISICDGCGKQEPMFYANGAWHKPSDWFQRADADGAQLACSRPCIDKVAEKTGKTSVVIPI
jgi:hypothetical protein